MTSSTTDPVLHPVTSHDDSQSRPRPSERRLLSSGEPLEAEPVIAVGDLVQVSSEVVDEQLRVRVAGEVDMLSSPALRDQLVHAPVPDGVSRVVVDLTAVRFMGSDGLGVLVAAHERLAAQSVRMSVLVAGTAVRRPLEITGLHQLLDVVVVDRPASDA